MEKLRKPFQGVSNIVRFNWHFYIGVVLLYIALFFLKNILPTNYNFIFTSIFYLTLIITFIVSFYIYDLSGLYNLKWLPDSNENLEIVNIHAGFDETSELLKSKYSNSNLKVLDFYDPKKYTEVSIKRARKAYPAYPNTISTTTFNLPIQTNSTDKIFVIFSTHEIRENNERVIFFEELNRILKARGEIYVTEHLRDFSNFFAYNIGFFHFLNRQSWLNVFSISNLTIKKEQKLNSFVTNFTLIKNGITT